MNNTVQEIFVPTFKIYFFNSSFQVFVRDDEYKKIQYTFYKMSCIEFLVCFLVQT